MTSLVQVHDTASGDRTTSPVLSSNNPFRNRTASPTHSGLSSPVNATFNVPGARPERPLSNNPFLDGTEQNIPPQRRPTSPLRDSVVTMDRSASPQKPQLTGHTVELFDNLTINGPTNGGSSRVHRPTSSSNRPQSGHRVENVKPKPRFPGPAHHASRSQEERNKMSNGKPRRGTDELNIFADPPKDGASRQRRNSESSIASRMPSPEEEQKRREKYRREREARHKEARSKHRPKKPSQRLDIIDNLDVTSIYGKGLFHHDGPFDACNPDRNRKGSRRAPMEAFAKDSANNVIGGSGPVNSSIDLNQFHGRGVEGFNDYGTAAPMANPPAEPGSYMGSSALNRKTTRRNNAPTPQTALERQSAFNPTEIVAPVHGQESMGLGTSTFLEGTPAAKAVIQRRESEGETAFENGGGLGRKRSLAQRIRGISNAGHKESKYHRPAISSNNRVNSHDAISGPNSGAGGLDGRPGLTSGESQSAGGMPKIHETRPFFQDYDGGDKTKASGGKTDEKGIGVAFAGEPIRRDSFGQEDTITVGGRDVKASGVEAAGGAVSAGRARAASNPQGDHGPVLERRVTHDGLGGAAGGGDNANGNGGGGGGGFLSRVKSLKGGKKRVNGAGAGAGA